MVQGGVLDPESDDLLQSSSSHSDRQGGPVQSPFLWQRRLFVFPKPFSALPEYTIGLYVPAPGNWSGHVAEFWLRECGWEERRLLLGLDSKKPPLIPSALFRSIWDLSRDLEDLK